MTEQVKSLRLRPEEQEFLNSQDFEQGQLFLRQDTNELVIMGDQRGGVALLKADLSNIQGGGGGTGSVDFGSRTIQADAFEGDGSLLTNLPVPAGVATLTDITTAISAIPQASTTVFGLVKVDGVSVTINGSGVISAVGGGGGGGGVDLTAFSVSLAPLGTSTLTYSNTTGVFTYTPPDLSGFLTSYTETDTLDSVLARGATSARAATITNTVTVDDLIVTDDATVRGTLSVTDILNSDTGAPKWTSGSDFHINMPGDLLLSGVSKIRGVADPIAADDVATKNYVDGAASAFDGGTVSGAVNITNTTASTNKDTGALIVNGGVGVEGSVYAGGLIYVFDTPSGTYTPVLTSASGGYNGGIISGTVFVNNSTTSTSITTGALRVLGGVGIQGNLNVGPDGRFNGIRVGRGSASGVGSDTNVALGGGAGNDAPLALNTSGLRNVAVGLGTLSTITSASDNVAVGRYAMQGKTAGDNNVAIGSSALTTGSGSSNTAVGAGSLGTSPGSQNTALGHDALHDIDGTNNTAIGFSAGSAMLTGTGNILIGGNDGSTIDGATNNILISDGSGNIRLTISETGVLTLPANVSSTTTTTGTLVVTGGVGISGAVNVGGALGIAGQISISNTTASSSTSTGSIVTLGGIGAAGNVHAAAFVGDGSGLTNVSAAGFAGGTVANATTFSSLVTINNGISTNNTANISLGSGTRQMLNLFGTTYGIGIQSNTLYYRSAGTFRWHRGGTHSNTEGAPGTGGTQALVLDASSNLTATGNVTAFSDQRLKTDIEIITDPIGKILQLDGVTFTRIDSGQRGLGVIAQQVQKVLPELIVVDENGYLSVAYGNLTGLLIEGVKAHEQDISQLKSQVVAQQLMIEQLMLRLSALEGSR